VSRARWGPRQWRRFAGWWTPTYSAPRCAPAPPLTTFKAQGHGSLVLVGSLLSLLPNPLVPLYSMTKFAIRGLALNLQQAVTGHPRIRVGLVLPGPVDTPFFQRAANHTGHRMAPRVAETFVARWSAASLTKRAVAAPGPGSLFDAPSTGAVHGGYRRGRVRRWLGEWLGAAQARGN
jgi:NAD(P)-dependent dehydrogenase (short-subunit alcohol dehydrogenase family)